MRELLKNYSNIILLLVGITTGSLIGLVAPNMVSYLKPIGEIFLNLIFVAVIPLLFFAITSSIGSIQQSGNLGKIVGTMMIFFVVTICIAAVATIAGLWLFPVSAVSDSNAVSTMLTDNSGESW